MDHAVKITDAAAILSGMLDLPFPFSNVGVMHPALAPDDDIQRLHFKYIENLKQINDFVQEYCLLYSK